MSDRQQTIHLRHRITQAVWVFAIMPTVLNTLGLRFVVYPNDHRPAHVHVMGNGCEAVFTLRCPSGPPALRENYGFSQKVLTQIGYTVSANLTHLCSHWEEIHGRY
ncbi:DUF4160 domain-containing protein [Massilia sp. SM-13]|uniref:DUF4160 domain-containing protein n=1 Tax=Pseudoduganella rhizocola TaxID=3382643 RepID=UPI0038B65B06